MKKLIRTAVFAALAYAVIIALVAPGLTQHYLEHGVWLTAAYYGSLIGLATLGMALLEQHLKVRAEKITGAETDDARAERVLHVALVGGSDRLNQDDYGFLMAWVAKKGEESRQADRAYRDAVSAYARHSKDAGPIVYAPGDVPLVKKNELTPFAEAI